MQKGTILYMGNFELPDKNAAAHRVMNNGKIFSSLDYKVVYLGIVREERFSGIRQSSYCEDIYEEAYPVGTKQWINHIFDTTNILSVADNYDDVCLVITYNVPFATYKAVKKAFNAKGIKVAYDCTEWNGYAEGSLPKRLYKKFDENRIRSKLHKHCDDIIVISKLMESKYRGKNLLKLPPLVDLDDSIWHQEKENHDGTFEFCFAGTTNNKEKIEVIVAAFSKIKNENLRFRIIGVEKDDYINAFSQHRDIVEHDSRINFMGRLSHEETVKFVLGCDCYIFIRESTTRNEAGFPTKFAESFTSGVPIISTDVSDIKDFADSKVVLLNGVSEETVLNAMKKAVDELESNGCLRDGFDYRNYILESERWLSKALTK